MPDPTCSHCNDPVDARTREHWTEGDGTGYGHHGLCCDCMDLSCGAPLSMINRERAKKGRRAITVPWPGRNAEGERTPRSA